jgi:hypothetical protein
VHIVNTTGDDIYLPAVGRFVENGETVEVDAELAPSLVEQGWTSAAQKAARKRARSAKKAAAASPEQDDDTSAPGDEPDTTTPEGPEPDSQEA